MRLTLALALVLTACTPAAKLPPPAPSPNPGNLATAENGWYRGDMHFHTNYSDDAKAQGGDDLAAALTIADAYRDPLFLQANPEWTGDGLDFVTVTDHRTDAALSDPNFKHDHLIVVPGEEYGGAGHATIAGLRKHIPQDPSDGETQDAHHVASVAEAHRQGAIFSINHPCQDNPWPWNVETVDGVEVWNGPWSGFYGESTLADLDAKVADGKAENPYIRAATAHRGGGANNQALWLWYGMLTRGHHPALIGGSDRHMLVPAALPTTYVRHPDDAAFAEKTGHSLGPDGIVAGLRAGQTFVSSSPHGPQILFEAEDASGVRHPVGSDLVAGASYTLRWKVTRASGGQLRLVGSAFDHGTGPLTPTPTQLHEATITGDVSEGSFTWVVPADGGWIHAIVLEPRVPTPLPPELAHSNETLSKLPPSGKAIGSMITVMGELVDSTLIFSPKDCDPSEWVPWMGECMPADQSTWETFYMPLQVLRLMNTWFEDGVATEYSLGALTSAFVAKPADL